VVRCFSADVVAVFLRMWSLFFCGCGRCFSADCQYYFLKNEFDLSKLAAMAARTSPLDLTRGLECRCGKDSVKYSFDTVRKERAGSMLFSAEIMDSPEREEWTNKIVSASDAQPPDYDILLQKLQTG
jgi:hypothetical protein